MTLVARRPVREERLLDYISAESFRVALRRASIQPPAERHTVRGADLDKARAVVYAAVARAVRVVSRRAGVDGRYGVARARRRGNGAAVEILAQVVDDLARGRSAPVDGCERVAARLGVDVDREVVVVLALHDGIARVEDVVERVELSVRRTPRDLDSRVAEVEPYRAAGKRVGVAVLEALHGIRPLRTVKELEERIVARGHGASAHHGDELRLQNAAVGEQPLGQLGVATVHLHLAPGRDGPVELLLRSRLQPRLVDGEADDLPVLRHVLGRPGRRGRALLRSHQAARICVAGLHLARNEMMVVSVVGGYSRLYLAPDFTTLEPLGKRRF